ncbi:MAG: hypothetical protein AB7V50_08510 [Vampirovibrionia bacterium]
MQSKDRMNEFLNNAVEHLLTHQGAFYDKLEKGDISAIKMVFDFVSKNSPKPLNKKHENNVTIEKIGDVSYDDAFEIIKDTLSQAIEQEDFD